MVGGKVGGEETCRGLVLGANEPALIVTQAAQLAAHTSTTNPLPTLSTYRQNEGFTPTTELVSTSSLTSESLSTSYRYVDGNETYTFVPVEPVGARSLTVYRNSGDIVLNRKLRSL